MRFSSAVLSTAIPSPLFPQQQGLSVPCAALGGGLLQQKGGQKERMAAQPWTALLRSLVKTVACKRKSFLCQHLGILSSKRKKHFVINNRFEDKELATYLVPSLSTGKEQSRKRLSSGAEGGLCGEARRDHVASSRVSVRKFLRIYLREEVSWKLQRARRSWDRV